MPKREIAVDKIISIIQSEQKLITAALVESDWFDVIQHDDPKVCESPGHCAIGALLFASGMTNQQLLWLPSLPTNWRRGTDPAVVKARRIIEEDYGLTLAEADEIVGANDNDDDEPLVKRQQSVIAVVKGLASDLERRRL